MSSHLVSLQAAREIRKAKVDDTAYHARLLAMDKLELLEEMVRFQEERSRVGFLTPSMMIRGRTLFSELEKSAETRELLILTRSYRRHLEFEMADYLRQGRGGRARTLTSEDEDLPRYVTDDEAE